MGRKKTKDNSTYGKLKEADPFFLEEVEGKQPEQLRNKLVDLAKNAEEIRKAREEDADLPVLKDKLKVANETYSIPLKGAALKTKYILELLEAKGA